MVSAFDKDGNLPPGIHRLSWTEFIAAFGWNDDHKRLMVGLKKALDDLRSAGCQTVYVDGSFVTAKDVPADFDACWERTGVKMRSLPIVLLTFDDDRAFQKGAYGGELFPADLEADTKGTRFVDFFQRDRDTGRSKGIVAIDLKDLP